MINIVGLGKKRIGMSHEESVRYHVEKHAPFGRRVAGPRGLIKYSGYYPDEAFSLEGKRLPELPLPWDLIVPESYTDEFWENMESWRRSDPDGIEATIDEARFCDRKAGVMVTCQINAIVTSGIDSTGIHVVTLINKKKDVSHEECINYHRDKHAPLVAGTLGKRLKGYTASYAEQGFNLEEGLLPEPPYDIIELALFADDFWKDLENWRNCPEGRKIAQDEERFMDRGSAVMLKCQNFVFIP